MYWMARPPYLRWLAAAGIVMVGILFEFSGRATTRHPFVAVSTPAGSSVTEDRLEWRDVPIDLFEVPELDAAVAAIDLPAGTPLVRGMLTDPAGPPEGWMAIPVSVPATAIVGSEVQLVLTATGRSVPGRVVAVGTDSGLGFDEPGLVAVPPEQVAAVAIAASTTDLVVALRTGP